jgi:hypothetical protein
MKRELAVTKATSTAKWNAKTNAQAWFLNPELVSPDEATS